MITNKSCFELDNVTVRYPSVVALSDVTLRIAEGEQIALVGPSGSGKTTFLRLLNGTLRPTSGKVRVGEEDTGKLAPAQLRMLRSRIGFVHQNLSLVPNLRVIQNVLCGRMGQTTLAGSLRMLVMTSRRETVDVHKLLNRVGIEEKLYERTDRLSGGQQQRVAIARALYQRPGAILADEPISSVDPARAVSTVKLLTDISTQDGLTLCMSLHNLDVARQFFPRLVGMRAGKIIFDRRTAAISEDEFKELYHLSDEEILRDLVEN